MNVTGINETKWFGKDPFEFEGYTILHSGRPLPEEAPMERNEGVGIVLDPVMAQAWRDGEEVWEAVSSRVVKARLKLVGEGCEDPVFMTIYSCVYPVFMTIVSVYVLTYQAALEKKVMRMCRPHRVPGSDVLLVVGDFNAQVGSSEKGADVPVWSGVRG